MLLFSVTQDHPSRLETSYTTMFRTDVCQQESKGKSTKPPW